MATTALEPDNWYAVGGSQGLPIGSVMPATILGKELVVWRDGGGAVHAWDNRCVHRGMRLSLGFVDGDMLACRYHGWRYGAGGGCARIPAHPDLEPPDTYCVTPYASAERFGLIWANTDASQNSEARLPDLDGLDSDVHFIRSLAVNVAPERVLESAAKSRFPPFAARDAEGPTGDERADFRSTQLAPGTVTIEAKGDAGRETLILAAQPVASDHTQVHVLVAADLSRDDVPAMRRHYAAWCRRWRWNLENDAPETTSGRASTA